MEKYVVCRQGDGGVLEERGVWVGQVGWELKKVGL